MLTILRGRIDRCVAFAEGDDHTLVMPEGVGVLDVHQEVHDVLGAAQGSYCTRPITSEIDPTIAVPALWCVSRHVLILREHMDLEAQDRMVEGLTNQQLAHRPLTSLNGYDPVGGYIWPATA